MLEHSFIDKFQSSIQDGLPGESAHIDLMPLNRTFSQEALKTVKDYRKSAVGLVLFEKSSTIQCVLIQRPKYEGAHGNQVSFPGGKMDRTDLNLEFTAKRECMEEIALEPHLSRTIGQLTQVYIPVSKFLVQPYVFFLDTIPHLIPDEREVDEIFTFDINTLLDNQSLKRIDLKLNNGLILKNIPYFDIEGRTVWGATAMILSEFKAILSKF